MRTALQIVLTMCFSLPLLATASATGAPAVADDSPGSEALPPARLPFRSYGLDQGLENLNIFAITQDAAGFLWVGTEDGAHRYDGAEFARYGLDEGLPSTTITFIAPAPSGGLWAGTLGGLARWDGHGFVAIGPNSRLPAENITGLGVDERGSVWVATRSGLFWSADGRAFGAINGWPRAATTALYVTPDGNEVFAATGSRVGRLGREGVATFWDLKETIGQEEIGALAVDAQGRAWARTMSFLVKMDRGSINFEDVSALLPPGRSRAYLALDRARNLCVPTNRGIMRHLDGQWSSIGGISEGFAHWSAVVFEDREGSLWVGGNGTGVFRMAGRGAWSSWSTAEGLPDSAVYCIFKDTFKQLWVGTRAGLCKATEIDFAVLQGTENYHIRSIAQTHDGHIWAAGTTPWILRFDPRTRSTTYYGTAEGVPEGLIFDLLVDSAGTLWAGTANGVLRFSPTPAPGRWQHEPLPGAERVAVRTIIEDRAGRIWAAAPTGVFRRDNDTWRRYTKTHGLQRDHVGYMMVDAGGDLWVAYWESIGVERFRVSGDALTSVARYTPTNEVRTSKCYFIGEDAHGQIWLGLGAGVNVIAGERIRHIGASDGLPGEDCNANAFLAADDGSVFVGTAFGLGRYRASAADLQPTPPIATIASARLRGKDLPVTGAAPVAGTADATFEVRYAGLSFVNERQVRHEIRLVGLEPEWRAVRVREARWPLLPAGTYRFEVRARLGAGPWSEPAGVSFEVRPAR
jgi:ligand-binding sensor domain-containing protein